jgi:uncharacterized protein YegL
MKRTKKLPKVKAKAKTKPATKAAALKTMICLILDRSGSMAGREKDVIGGVNTFLDEQKKLPHPASVAFVRFDTGAIERFRPMGPLKKAEPLVAGDYVPQGGTPLLDAIGQTIVALDSDWKTEKPDQAIVVIVTDGLENSSTEYKKAQIKDMITSREASGKWMFVYLAANVDAFAEAGAIGVLAANTAGYTSTAAGTAALYSATSQTVSATRMTGSKVAGNLGGDIKEDGKVEKKKGNSPSPIAAAKPWLEPKWTPPQ